MLTVPTTVVGMVARLVEMMVEPKVGLRVAYSDAEWGSRQAAPMASTKDVQ